MTYITTKTEMREAIGTPPNAIYLKKHNLLEEHSKRYLKMSHLIAVTSNKLPTRIQLIATRQNELKIVSDTQFTLVVKNNDGLATSIQDEPCGLYILVAGFEVSLRINGTICVSPSDDGGSVVKVDIDEHYFHCAKSIKRSQFWTPVNYALSTERPLEAVKFFDQDIHDFMEKASFLLLATENHKREVDLSPRGDPGGFIRVLNENTVLIPERPGNRIADSLTNLIGNSSMAIILLIPGAKQSLILTGNGKLTNSRAVLEDSKLRDKTPKLGIEMAIENIFFGANPALVGIDLWETSDFVDPSVLPSLGVMISDQMQTLGKIPGSGSTLGRVLGKMVGVTSDLLIKQDYKKNLY